MGARAVSANLARRNLTKGPAGEVDFTLRGIDRRNVNMLEVFGRRVVDCRRRIGAAQCANGDEDGADDGGSKESEIAGKDCSMLDLILVAIGVAGLVYLAFYYRRR